jgi:CDGSH-type Zn-finger protein
MSGQASVEEQCVQAVFSGERTPLACWRSHSAIADFATIRRLALSLEFNKRSSPQNAATSTLQACAPQNAATSCTRERHYVTRIMVTIETIRNGPYIVAGEVELIDADGNRFPVEKRMALCRCGASTEKPFCDGTHSKIGFKAAEKAVPESKE